jgi:hypothetical protein
VDSGGTADIQYVYVGWLKNPSQMPPGVTARLQHYGLTTADYTNILKQDPFANGSGAITARYQPLNTNFPYEPPFSPGDPVPTYTFVVSNSSMSTTTSAVDETYQVGLTVKTGASFIASASLESDNNWAWTNSSSKASSTGGTESATVTVGGPSFGYTGSTDMQVFYDRIYRSFLFVPIEEAPSFKGKVANRRGQPVAFREVTVTAGGTKYRTFTDAKGEYRIFGKVKGPLTIKTGGITRSLRTIENGRGADIQLK